jgi:hypothetical protein
MIPAVAFGALLLAGVACNEKRDEVRQIAAEQLVSQPRSFRGRPRLRELRAKQRVRLVVSPLIQNRIGAHFRQWGDEFKPNAIGKSKYIPRPVWSNLIQRLG